MRTDLRCLEFELYIHIPFCIRKCSYCDFLSFSSDENTRQKYVEALKKELIYNSRILYHKETGDTCVSPSDENRNSEVPVVRSIFIGGGTPSVLASSQIEGILQCVKRHYLMNEDAEISMEANPGTLDEEKLLAMRKAGVNRLSIGLQTTKDRLLRTLGRIHTYEEFCHNYNLARKCGFDNINIDLMSALPGQTLEEYEETLHTVLNLAPEHISSYSLIIEEGTPFAKDPEILASLPDEEMDRRMYDMTKQLLQEKGYARYEISNYAKEGRQCSHNLGYWSDISYIGAGLGASSYLNGRMAGQKNSEGIRFQNTDSMDEYLKNPEISIDSRRELQVLTRKDHMEEYMFLGLRKMEGVSEKKFYETFAVKMEEIYGKVIQKYIDSGFLEWNGEYLRLTEAGIDVSNHIFSEFLLEE